MLGAQACVLVKPAGTDCAFAASAGAAGEATALDGHFWQGCSKVSTGKRVKRLRQRQQIASVLVPIAGSVLSAP